MSSEASGNIPYLVISDELKKKLREYSETDRRIRQTWKDFAKKFGSTSPVFNNYQCVGVVFADHEVPDGWIHRHGDLYGMYCPKSKSKDYKYFTSLPNLIANRNKFAEIVGTNGFIDCRSDGLYSVAIGLVSFRIKEEAIFILLAPIPSSFKGRLEDTPEYQKFPFLEVRELTWSEYFQMKEEAGDA